MLRLLLIRLCRERHSVMCVCVCWRVCVCASTPLGMLSTRCWNIAAGTCFHSATRALVRSVTDVGRLGLAHSRCSKSSQRCAMELRAGLCGGQSSSSTIDLDKPFLYGPCFPQTVATKLEADNHLECHCML